MDVELIEIRDFLAEHPPFDHLPDAALDRLPSELSVRYLRRGTPFPPKDADGDYLYIVRKGAVEFRDGGAELVGKFGEGELCPSPCLSDGTTTEMVGAVVEDSLFYLIPCSRLRSLREEHTEFNDHFDASVRDRLRKALQRLREPERGGNGLLTVEVGELVARSPVHAAPDTTIRQAARLMSAERVSALLIVEDRHLVGIITDRDLRSRVVADGLDIEQPISAIMTRKLFKVSADTSGFEALLAMTRLNVHHLPVMDANGVRGLVTTSDLIRYQSNNSVYLVGDIRRGESVVHLVATSRQIPELHLHMVAAGASADHLGRTLSAVTDALTKRLLELAERELGPAPVPYAWLACGSQGRQEQTSVSDQDNALLLSDDYVAEQHGPWFERLAQFVSDGLNACGYVHCPGKVMATNPKWRQPFKTWRGYFEDWIANPERKALMLASNFFDLRYIAGEETLYHRLRADILHMSQANKIFLAYMAANALANRPPLGFFRNFVLISDGDHANTFDLKRRAIIPVVDLARVYALSAGLPEINTADRLAAAADASALSEEGAANLADAFEFITTLRARHQAEQIKRGDKPDNYVTPNTLSSLERTHLKDAFSVISTMQDALAQRYQTSRFF